MRTGNDARRYGKRIVPGRSTRSLEVRHMSQTTCPSCGFGFDNQRPVGISQLRGRLLFGPERVISKPRVDSNAYDTCPKCGTRFLSSEMNMLRALARLKLQSAAAVYGGVALLIVVVGVVVWLFGK